LRQKTIPEFGSAGKNVKLTARPDQ